MMAQRGCGRRMSGGGKWRETVQNLTAESQGGRSQRPPVEKGAPNPKVSDFVDESEGEGNEEDVEEDKNEDNEMSHSINGADDGRSSGSLLS